MTVQIRLAHRQPLRAVIDSDVRLNTFGLDRSAIWRVVTGGSQLDGTIVAQRQYCLHRAFTERLRTHDARAFVVLQGTSNDFRSRCCPVVD